MRLLFADVVPIVPDFWNNLRAEQGQKEHFKLFKMPQTNLMQACRYGHWEVVQTLVLHKKNVR